jgi:hypothetical protein
MKIIEKSSMFQAKGLLLEVSMLPPYLQTKYLYLNPRSLYVRISHLRSLMIQSLKPTRLAKPNIVLVWSVTLKIPYVYV